MSCCQCQGIEEVFSPQYVARELARYRAKGPEKTTRMLTDALQGAWGVGQTLAGATLLDIGGGVGAIQHALLRAGVAQVTGIEAAGAYIQAAREEATRLGAADRVRFEHGDFVALAEDIAPADIVTLDRVICCYPDMQALVGLSAARARKLYGVVYPRATWWTRLGQALVNGFYRLQRSAYRGYVHPTRAVEAILGEMGFTRRAYRQTLVWQVAVYGR